MIFFLIVGPFYFLNGFIITQCFITYPVPLLIRLVLVEKLIYLSKRKPILYYKYMSNLIPITKKIVYTIL